jgi:hypothetical protein
MKMDTMGNAHGMPVKKGTDRMFVATGQDPGFGFNKDGGGGGLNRRAGRRV